MRHEHDMVQLRTRTKLEEGRHIAKNNAEQMCNFDTTQGESEEEKTVRDSTLSEATGIRRSSGGHDCTSLTLRNMNLNINMN